MNLKSKRKAAFIAAFLMSGSAIAHYPACTQKAGAKAPSVRDFADSVLPALPEESDSVFASLYCAHNGSQLLKDGEEVRDGSCSAFRVIDGELCIAASETVRAGETPRKDYLTLEEAAPLIGLETYETADGVYVSDPFRSGTLIVKTEDPELSIGASEIGSGWDDLHVLQYPTAADAYAAYQAFQADDDVIFAEPNRVFHIAADPGYAFPADNWGWDAVGADSFLTQYEASAASAPEVIAAVIDTGLYPEHNWFRGRIAEGGASFIADGRTGYEDPHGHGTHCAGIICGMTADNVRILPLRVLNAEGYGSTLGIYCAMRYAAEQNVDVVNMSLGGIGCSPLLEEAVRALNEKEIPCVAAAGNDTQDAAYSCPANIPDVITISSVSKEYNELYGLFGMEDPRTEEEKASGAYWLSPFSNYGSGIDFAAPGDMIESAGIDSPDSIVQMSGTSMAAPHVTGCIADILTLENDFAVSDIYACLRANANDLGEPGFDEKFGWGLVNLDALDFTFSELTPPEVSHSSGQYSEVFSVTLSCTDPNAEIRYTTDGTYPDIDTGILYQGEEILIDNVTDLCAVTVKDGRRSIRIHRQYTLGYNPPFMRPKPKQYDEPLTVSLSAGFKGTAIYTLDGSDPTLENGILYTGPFEITETTLIKLSIVIGRFVSEPTAYLYSIGGQKISEMFETENGVLTHYYGHEQDLDLNEFFAPGEITRIGEGAFEENGELAAIILPDSVVSIAPYAFRDCNKLRTVTAPGVEILETGCFEASGQIEKIDMPALKTIGPSAFSYAFCFDAEPIAADNQIETIGDDAFYNSRLGKVVFPNLKTLGSSAFCSCSFMTEAALSPGITVLPDSAFFDCDSLVTLDTPGVTELRDYALYLDNYVDTALETCTIDFSGLTSVGAQSLSIFRGMPMRSVTFDSLTYAGEQAFRLFPAEELHLPALKQIAAGTFRDAMCSAVYLEHAEKLKKGALSQDPEDQNHITFIFGEHVSPLQKNPLETGCGDITVAAPQDSPMIRFAQAAHCDYLCTPDIYIPDSVCSCMQHDPVVLSDCIPLTFGGRVVFTALETDYASGYPAPDQPFYPDDSGEQLILDTSVPGTVTLRADLVDDAGTVLTSKTLVCSIRTIRTEETVTKEGVFVMDWNQAQIPELPDVITLEDINEYIETTYVYRFCFVPEEDGEYYFIPETSNMSISICYAENGQIGHTPQMPVQSTDAEAVELKAGETYDIVVKKTVYWGWNEQYSGILITRQKPEQVFTRQFNVQTEQPAFTKGTELPEISDVTVCTDSGQELEQDVDYQFVYVREGNVGTVYVFGTGDYRGMLKKQVYCYEDYTFGETMDLPEMLPGQTLCYHFRNTDSNNSRYLISASLSETCLREYASGMPCDISDRDMIALDVLDADAETLSSSSSNYFFCEEGYDDLEAGNDYYITVTNYSDSTIPAGMYALSAAAHDNSHWLSYCEFDIIESLNYSGKALNFIRSAEDPDGNALKEGRDYLVYADNNRIPGSAKLIIRGIGAYYGLYDFMTEITEPGFRTGPLAPEPIRLNTPFTVRQSCGIYELQTESCCQCSLRKAGDPDADAPFLCSVTEYDTASYEWVVLYSGNSAEEEITLNLEPGCYHFSIAQNAEDQTYILDTQETLPGISKAAVHSEILTYTGEELVPQITLTYGGKTLTEGEDYLLLLPDQPIAACGIYDVTAAGIGDFCGECTVRVIVSAPDGLPEIQTGENTLALTESGQEALCEWIPEDTNYGIRMQDLQCVSLMICDPETNEEVLLLEGNGYLYGFFDVTPGKKYLVRASYINAGVTGEISFALFSDYTDLTACTLDAPSQMMYTKELPAYTVKDGETVLQKDIDYTVWYSGGNNKPGHAMLSLTGAGNCIGELEYHYYLAPEPAALAADDTAGALKVNQETNARVRMPGDMQQFVFEAPADGRYRFKRPDPQYAGVCVFAYAPDQELLPQDACTADLKKGEKLLFAAVSDHYEDSINTDAEYTLAVYSDAPGYELRSGDSVYLILNGFAYLDQYTGGNTGIRLPETVYDPEQDTDIPVIGYTPELLTALGPACTFYCEPDSESYAYMQEHGICFAVPEPQTGIRGDITGDGAVNVNDWLTLMRWLNECPGMLMHDPAYAAADLNEDGCLDLLDANALMEFAAADTPL